MHKASLVACYLALGLALPAAAQQKQAPDTPAAAGNQANGGGQMLTRMKVQKDLEQAGFTEVRVVPESFAVHAKTKEGQPVFMIIERSGRTMANGSGVDLATGKHDAP